MHDVIAAKREALGALCHRFGVTRLEVFGSAARGTDFTAASDADLLVSFASDRQPSLVELLDLEDALSVALGRPVDLVEREAIEASRNYIRRQRILAEAETIYEG